MDGKDYKKTKKELKRAIEDIKVLFEAHKNSRDQSNA